jgi:hypothetical protein
MQIPFAFGRIPDDGRRLREVRSPPANRRRAKLMHSHGNPNRDIGPGSIRIAALQTWAGSAADLIDPESGETRGCMLDFICSL